ncbi:MAG: transcription elongation factor GreA [Clostridiales bacterium]|jgi:transcription elongation factor greA|nr:transcription elongation factor GreA [Clostridiales bacterium]
MAEQKPTHLTREGLKHYQERLEYLKGEKTMEIIKRIEIARGFGDLSENSEYDDAKREQQENEAEKHRIEEILKNYVLIDETDLNTDTVRLGQCVTLYDYDFEEEVEYYLVGSTEADPIAGKISNESPVGQAILGKKVDDIVEVETLDGVVKYKIVKIRIPDKKA